MHSEKDIKMVEHSRYDCGEQDIHDRWVEFKQQSLRENGLECFEENKETEPYFTRREQDVLAHLVHGKKNKDIADALGVKTVTVKLHVRSICRKLNASNRTQAALFVNELGLFEK